MNMEFGGLTKVTISTLVLNLLVTKVGNFPESLFIVEMLKDLQLWQCGRLHYCVEMLLFWGRLLLESSSSEDYGHIAVHAKSDGDLHYSHRAEHPHIPDTTHSIQHTQRVQGSRKWKVCARICICLCFFSPLWGPNFSIL